MHGFTLDLFHTLLVGRLFACLLNDSGRPVEEQHLLVGRICESDRLRQELGLSLETLDRYHPLSALVFTESGAKLLVANQSRSSRGEALGWHDVKVQNFALAGPDLMRSWTQFACCLPLSFRQALAGRNPFAEIHDESLPGLVMNPDGAIHDGRPL